MKQLQQVVVIEEHRQFMQWFCQVLPALGWCVALCPLPTGIQGFVARQQPHLVLLNMCLQKLNSRLMAYLLKQNPITKTIPLLCYGPLSPSELAQEQQLSGADGYLLNPKHPPALAKQLLPFQRQFGHLHGARRKRPIKEMQQTLFVEPTK